MKLAPISKTKQKKTPPKKEDVFTKDDFLNALKKVSRPVLKKVRPSKEKRKTSE